MPLFTIVIFIVVLVALIVVHELGHFIAAKLSGMRVDEFGLGLPPRAVRIAKIGETEYTLNWLPIGGFVKIFGENGGTGSRAFGTRPRILQAIVLLAGISMNLVFAYVLITGALIAGTPRALTPEEIPTATDVKLAVAEVIPGSPAARAGIVAGDTILGAEDGHFVFSGADPKEFTDFVARGGNATLAISILHADGKKEMLFARPEKGIHPEDPSRAILGVLPAPIGIVPLSFIEAVEEGFVITRGVVTLTAQGLVHFFYRALTLSADLSQVAGPVGIAVIVGDAALGGLGGLLPLVAIISVNLALINLIPVPALDGGRLLFVIIESITRKPIAPRVANSFYAISMALLVLLILVVTTNDIIKIVS
jgi:regulator of sigma E protease